MLLRTAFLFVALSAAASVATAAPGFFPTFTDAASAGPDFLVQGEYEGHVNAAAGQQPAGAQVIAKGDARFHAVLYYGGLPGSGWNRSMKKEEFDGSTKDNVTTFNGKNLVGKLVDGTLSLTDSGGQMIGELKKIERKSPTLGAQPPADAVVILDGTPRDKIPGGGELVDGLLVMGPPKRGDAKTTEAFGNYKLHLEFRTPFMPTATGQQRGNSGLYLSNRYECQVLDSFGLSGEDNECGGFYKFRKPDVNMCFPPLAWQTYDIDFTAPKFDASGIKTAPATVTVRHNSVVIHNKYELPDVTPGGERKEGPTGILKLQDHGNPVAYRNFWVVPVK